MNESAKVSPPQAVTRLLEPSVGGAPLRDSETGALRQRISALETELEAARRNCAECQQEVESLRATQLRDEGRATRFQELLDSLPEAIFETDGRGRFTYANRAAFEMFGREPAELAQGMYPFELLAPTERERAMERFRQLGRGEPGVPTEYAALRKDGSSFPVLIHSIPIQSGSQFVGIRGILVDITERKRVERALRESELNYRRLYEGMMDGFGAWDLNGRILESNRAFQTMLGYSEIELRQLSYIDLTPERWRAMEAGVVRDQVWARGYSEVYEKEYRRKSGELVPVELRAYLLRDSSGQPSGYWTIVRDITERKRAEEQLRQSSEALQSSHQRLLDTIEFLPEPTFIVDQDQRVIAWNRACELLTGVKKEALLGQGDCAYAVPFYGQRRPMLIDLLDQSSAEAEGRYDHVERVGDRLYGGTFAPLLNHGQGAHLWGAVAPLFDRDGKRFGAIEVIHDITDRKRAEQALRESEERLRSITSAALDAIVMMDEQGCISFWNRAAERLFGYSSEEALGQNLHGMLASSVYQRAYQGGLTQFLATGQGAVLGQTVELVAKHRSGRELPVELSVAAVRVGDKLQAVGIIRDIGERKRAEEALAKFEEHLRQSQKLEAIGTLAGGIAHDFNNILGAMMSYTELARRGSAGNAEVQEYLDQVLKACVRAKDLVCQILSFSRQRKQDRKPIAIQLVVKEALRLLRSSLPTSIEMVEHLSGQVPQILADPTQIHQVLVNLCTNAAHAMRQQQGRLEVSLEPFQVEQAFVRSHPDLRPGRYVRLCVSDNGQGMDEAVQKRIFEPFFTTKGPGEGTGLGLAVVHGIVKEHDGAIYVQSQPGQGALFEIFFPALARDEEHLSPPSPQLILGHQERILVVDDEEVLCSAMSRMLRALNYLPTTQTDPRRALAEFSQRPDQYDLVITDLTMPGLSGVDLAAALLAVRPGLPVLLTSGFNATYTPEMSRNLGIQGLIQKPVGLTQLGGAVHQALACSASAGE